MDRCEAHACQMRIYKRGATYYAQFQGRRVSLKTGDRIAAELAFRELQRRAADPGYRPPDTTQISLALAEFAEHQRQRGRSPGSIRRTLVSREHLVRVMGDVPLAGILDSRIADGYVAARMAEGASGLTVARELSAFGGALRLAAKRGRFSRPIEAVMPSDFSPGYRPLERHLTYSQIDYLRAELPRHRAAVVGFVAATAADYRSVLLAQRADFAAGTILVRGTKNPHRWRTLPVLPQFAGWVEEAAAAAPFQPWPNSVRDLTAACKRAGVPRVTLRDLRRSHGKMLRAAGVPPHLIGLMLGHKDSTMAERVYATLGPSELGALVVHHSRQPHPHPSRPP